MRGGIPHQGGSVHEEFLRGVLSGSRKDLREIASQSGSVRIQQARDRIVHRLTLGVGTDTVPALVHCTTDEQRREIQSVVVALELLVRHLRGEMETHGEASPPEIEVY